MPILDVTELELTIGNRTVCRNLDIQLTGGQMLGILGRNGVGKTTLLHTVMGFHKPDGGTIRLCGSSAENTSRRQMARQVGLLFQESDTSMPATVMETVLLGRHPYSENLLWDSPADIALATRTLAEVGLEDLAHRQVSTLSGGEKQRLAVALLMTQDPELYLLDEPSNHLDIDYQIRLLELLARRVREKNAALLMASHDINLVARFCDRVLLLLGHGEVLEGPVQAVLDTVNLERAFHCKIKSLETSERRYFLPA